MNFKWKKTANLKIGQRLFGIIGVSSATYDGVYPITLDYIDWNEERLIFTIDQPCQRVSCSFHEVKYYVFESESEAEEKKSTLEWGVGMYAY